MHALDTKSRAGPDVSPIAPAPAPPLLSEVASRGIKRGARHCARRQSWRATHAVDARMRDAFRAAAQAIETMNYALNRSSYRMNVMVTLNADALVREGETAQVFFQRIMKALGNLFRGCRHTYAGVWRFEIGTARYGGRHYHVAFHAPRGMRDRVLAALQRWFDEPLDEARSHADFRRSKWRVVGVRGGWQVARVYTLEDALDYLAKTPLDAQRRPVSREARLTGAQGRVREYGVFGLRRKPADSQLIS